MLRRFRDACRDPIHSVALLIGAGAALLRAVVVLTHWRTPRVLADPLIYLAAAEHIATGGGYLSLGEHPTAYYPPGYPYFVGIIRWFLGVVGLESRVVPAVGVTQAVLGGVTAGLVALLAARCARSIGLDSVRRAAVTAGIVYAVWPNLVLQSVAILPETLFLTFFTGLLLCLAHMDAERTTDRTLLVTTGLLAGTCVLIRPQSTLLVLVGAVLVILVVSSNWRAASRLAAALAFGTVVVLTPWTVRNAVRMHAFVPLSTNTGDNLCIGFNPDATGGFMMTDHCATDRTYADGIDAELDNDRIKQARALRWARSNPGRLPALSIDKIAATFGGDTDGLYVLESFGEDRFLAGRERSTLRMISNGFYWIVLISAIGGIAMGIRRSLRGRTRDPALAITVMSIVAAVAVPALSFGDMRFKGPAVPGLAVCAALLAASATRDPTPYS